MSKLTTPISRAENHYINEHLRYGSVINLSDIAGPVVVTGPGDICASFNDGQIILHSGNVTLGPQHEVNLIDKVSPQDLTMEEALAPLDIGDQSHWSKWLFCLDTRREPFMVSPEQWGPVTKSEAQTICLTRHADIPTHEQLNGILKHVNSPALKDRFNLLNGGAEKLFWVKHPSELHTPYSYAVDLGRKEFGRGGLSVRSASDIPADERLFLMPVRTMTISDFLTYRTSMIKARLGQNRPPL